MRKVDYEAHLTTAAYAAADAAMTGREGGPTFKFTVADRVAHMDKLGIDAQIVSCAGGLERFDLDTATYVARNANDEFAEMMVKYPGRFYGYATLIPQDIEGSILELERCSKELHFPAWNTHTNFTKTYIDDDEYFPLLQKADELGMFVYLHPGPPSIERLNGLGGMLNGGLGYHVDGMITLTRLVCKGVFDRLPNLKIMLGHYGEALPFMIDRIDSLSKQYEFNSIGESLGNNGGISDHSMRYYFENNIFVTTSGNFDKAAFICTKESIGIERMLFGTDYPIEKYEQTLEFLDGVGMTQEEAEKLYYRNSKEYFGI